METFPISMKLLNQIIGYLGTRPYQESFQMIQALQAEVAKGKEDSQRGDNVGID